MDQARQERIKRIAAGRRDGKSFRQLAEEEHVSLGQVQRDLQQAAVSGDTVAPECGRVYSRDGKLHRLNRPAVSDTVDSPGPTEETIAKTLRGRPYRKMCFLFGRRACRRAMRMDCLMRALRKLVGDDFPDEFRPDALEDWQDLRLPPATSKEYRTAQERREAQVYRDKYNRRVDALCDKVMSAIRDADEDRERQVKWTRSLCNVREEEQAAFVDEAWRIFVEAHRKRRPSPRQVTKLIIEVTKRHEWYSLKDLTALVAMRWKERIGYS